MSLLLGDLNAKVGDNNENIEGVMGRHGLGSMNDNGERLASFCAENNLVIGGTLFPHKKIHTATWKSPDQRTFNQIDHICISKRFRRSLLDVKVQRGADVQSDHYLLTSKVQLKLKKLDKVSNPRKK
jgi:endonuclease/exonuclease/phosphatase family metal-dependent hydrolase